MKEQTVFLPVDIVQNFMKDTFLKLGVPENDAIISSEVLIKSDLRGILSHGIGRLKMYYDRIRSGQHQPITHFEISKESLTTAVVDGHHGMGMVIGVKAMQLAIEKASNFGMGSVAVRNSTHFGIDGYYVLMAINSGMIGISFTNARPAIAPTFGVQPMLGTNPIAFGCPTDEECPFVFDGATSITQRGKFEVLAREDNIAPDGWVIDQQGNSVNNPSVVLDGLGKNLVSLLPLGGYGEQLGGHKGYGLATIVEILSASLQGGSYLSQLLGIGSNGELQPFRLGHFFLAINIESFTPIDEFKKTTGNILRQLRNARKAPGENRIYTAGEKEFEMEKIVRSQGVPINVSLQKEIKLIQNELSLFQYKFQF